MDLSIIIINWNSKDYVAACLRSIFEHAPSVPFEVIVLDSGSFDGCGERIARDFPQVLFIQSPENLGFARANNLAVAHARGDTFLFLNPDTEVKADAINRLYQTACDSPRAGAVGARLLNTDGTLQTSCVQAFPTILNQVLISDFLIWLIPNSPLWGKGALFQHTAEPQEVEAVSGAAILMRRDVFEKIGGFCEEYFMYSEDIDLCLQARRSGCSNLYVSRAVITHHGGGSSMRQPSRFACTMKVTAIQHYFRRNRSFIYSAAYRCGVGGVAVIRLFLLVAAMAVAKGVGKTSPYYRSIPKWWLTVRWAVGMESRHSKAKNA